MEILYYEAAQEYLRSLPLEHFMESTPQAHQREITLASLALVHAVVTRHEGTITCDSAEGRGTTFTIVLPLDE